MASTSCVGESARALACRDGKAAAHLKLVSIFAIFVTSVVGVSLPVVLARLFQGRPTYDRVVLIVKCFAAGVILSTSLVHVLPDAFAALSDCHVVSHHPWKDFPFSGLLTLIGALLALLVDLTASSHVETRNHPIPNYTPISSGTTAQDSKKSSTAAVLPVSCHAIGHEHEHEHEHEEQNIISIRSGGSAGGDHHQELMLKLKQRLVSQVLEIGIIFHSVIIGVTMGMSQNQCTIRPLVAALSFHQIFEGLGLGGCIAQAGFGIGTTSYMCFMFAVTTPMGIVVGMMVFSATGYDESSANALIMEGLLGSLSSGVLIYMALVDLVAVDFFHNKMMASAPFLKKASFIALTLGSFFMSILAIWA